MKRVVIGFVLRLVAATIISALVVWLYIVAFDRVPIPRDLHVAVVRVLNFPVPLQEDSRRIVTSRDGRSRVRHGAASARRSTSSCRRCVSRSRRISCCCTSRLRSDRACDNCCEAFTESRRTPLSVAWSQ
jgi:hypothetical protein